LGTGLLNADDNDFVAALVQQISAELHTALPAGNRQAAFLTAFHAFAGKAR
jgi:hypothetical protein